MREEYNNMNERNYGIDLLRIVSMYGVIILHIISIGGGNRKYRIFINST